MNLDGGSDQALSFNENKPPAPGLRLSRSPHPYHRHRDAPLEIQQREGDDSTGQTLCEVGKNARSGDVYNSGIYMNSEAPKRWKDSVSPSDSGTEADDENDHLLRVLPAPPLKARKGFKDGRGSAFSSPSLTPTYLDDNGQRLALESRGKCRGNVESSILADEESTLIRNKFTRRRRAELLRRLSEVFLLGAVGFISCGNLPRSFLCEHKREIAAYACVILGTYLLYLFQTIQRRKTKPYWKMSIQSCLRIPAAFDPAPLLYPTFLPVFVAILLAASSPCILLLNLVLSIASIPNEVLIFHDKFSSISVTKWLLSMVPLLQARKGAANYHSKKLGADLWNLDGTSAENIAMLYPLHQLLLDSLRYLTTTSLLPAELQLVSISMINLLFFSSSPQALILQILLWVGGMAIFILCAGVLQWAVALARVPSWRFRRPQRRSREGFVFLAALDDCLKGRLNKWGIFSSIYEYSEAEDEPSKAESSNRKGPPMLKLKTSIVKQPGLTLPASAIDGNIRPQYAEGLGSVNSLAKEKNRPRRHTVLSYIGSPPRDLSQKKPKSTYSSRFSLIRPRSFLSLTRSQAVVVKWSFAAYVYAIVAGIIGIPVRIAVGRWALQGREPLGWALGYLFGNLSQFRDIVRYLNLENWVCLPKLLESSPSWQLSDWERPLQNFGAANVRLAVCVYCTSIIALGLNVEFRLTSLVEVDTRRKVFHGMMVVMFIPSIFLDPPFAALALALVLAIFLLLDLFRASQLPPLSRPLTHFLAPYVDGRDHRGPVIVSHIFLLIGCSIPLWLSLAAIDRTGQGPWEGWDIPTRDLSMVSGVICVGMGDAAASLIGRRFGRRRWCWSGGKSLEGSFAFAVAVILGLSVSKLGLRIGQWENGNTDSWVLTMGKASLAAVGSSLTEAVLTGGNDNVIVPVILWLLVKGLKM